MDKCAQLCIYLFQVLVVYGTEITKPPVNIAVFTGSDALFACEAEFSSDASGTKAFTWRLNGTSAVNLNFSTVTVGNLSTLTIPAMSEYNGTVVQCVAGVIGGHFTESKNATLLIQGPLASVGDVSVEDGRDSILLSWSPPFSLDVTGMDPDVWYSVLISNVTDEGNPTAVPCTDCRNLTQPHYTFTTANPSPCHKYSFIVIPQNGAGEGHRSELVEGAFVAGIFDVSEVKLVVKYINDTSFAVSLDLQLVGICSNIFAVYINGVSTGPLPLIDGTRLEFNVSTEGLWLKYDSKYQITIEGRYGNERFNASRTFLLSTFDVQKVEVTVRNEILIIMKEFMVNSPAQGYFVIVKSNSSSPDQVMAVLNTSSPAVVTGLESNTYDILVYDVEKNGLPNEKPAVEIKDKVVCQEGAQMRPEKSLVLNNVIIECNSYQVNITCNFRNDYSPSTKCVVLSRKSTESVLNVEYYPSNTNFPVILPLFEPGSYSVAVFGWKNGMIEPYSVQSKQVDILQGSLHHPTNNSAHQEHFWKMFLYTCLCMHFFVQYVIH